MEAAVDFAKNVKTYFVVGGSEKKVTDMKNISKSNGKSARNNIVQESSGCDLTRTL